jgi:hypothetical protein
VQVLVKPATMPDQVFNYNSNLLQWGLHMMEMKDAVKEGDPFRTNINLKKLIPFFFLNSTRSHYFVECINYILQTELLLPERVAMAVRLGSFCNTHGGKGGNKACDMQQEINIAMTKDVIKGLGASKTPEAMVRGTRAAPVIQEVVQHYQALINVHSSRTTRSSKDNKGDVVSLIEHFREIHPLEFIPGRTLDGFKDIAINNQHFSSIQNTIEGAVTHCAQRLRVGSGIDLAVESDDSDVE